MRRWIRRIIILAVVFLVLVSLLLVPAIQKALFLAFASTDERPVAVESIRIWPGSLKVEGLEFSEGNLLARVPSVEARFSTAALLGGELHLQSLRIPGIYVKSGEAEESAEQEDSAGFEVPPDFAGVLGRTIPLRVANASIDGLFVAPDQSEVRFALRLSDIAPGETGLAEIELTPTDETSTRVPSAGIRFPITLDSRGNLARVQVEGTVSSRSPEAIGAIDLSGGIVPTEEGESYQLEASSSELLPEGVLSLKGAFDRESGSVDLRVTARGQSLDFLESISPQEIPTVAFDIEGKTRLSPGAGLQSVEVRFQLDAAAGTVPRFPDPIRADGRLKISSGDGSSITVEELHLAVAPPQDARPWIAVDLLQPQTFSLEATAEIPESPLASVALFLPESFLNSFETGWQFSDMVAQAEILGTTEGLELRTTEPWTVAAAPADSPARVHFSLKPFLTYGGESTTAKIEAILSGSDHELAIQFDGSTPSAAPEGIDFDFEMQGSAQTLNSLLPEAPAIHGGTLTATGKGLFSNQVEFEGSIQVDELALDSQPPVSAHIRLGEFRFSQTENPTFSATIDSGWEANGSQSSLSGWRLRGVQGDSDRWTLAVDEGTMMIDPDSFPRAPSADAAEPEAGDPTSPRLPRPSDIEPLWDPPALPMNIETFNVEGKVALAEGDRTLRLSASGIAPGEEGEFSASMAPADPTANALAASLSGKVRLNSGGAPSRVQGVAEATGVLIGGKPTRVAADFTYSPALPVDPITLRMTVGESDVSVSQLRIAREGDSVSASLEADLAEWTQTPLRFLLPNLATGQVKGNAVLRESGLRSDLTIKALTPLDAFESYDLQMDAKIASLSPLAVETRFIVIDEKDKASDLQLRISGDPSQKLDVAVEGTRIDLETLEGFAAVWNLPREGEPSPPDEAPGSADNNAWPLESLPFDLTGTIAVGELLPVDLPPVRSVDGRIFANSERATLRLAAGWIDSSSLSIEGRITRSAKDVEGTLNAKLSDLPIGKFLREANPRETPSVEGLATLGLDFSGSASTLATLPNEMVGNLDLTVLDGVIRSLKPGARVTRFVNAGSVAGIILGAKLNRPGVIALSEVAELFKSIPFDELTLQLERTAAKETVIESLLLRGPYLFMQGDGRVGPGDLEDIPTTPMKINLRLGSKAPLTDPLEVLALLGPADALSSGYRQWKEPITLSGTFEKPDTSELWSLVLAAVERAATLSTKDLNRERSESGSEPAAEPENPSTEEMIEQGVNSLLDLIGGGSQ